MSSESSGRPDRLGPWAAAVFDCDGVLIESVAIKTYAFTELFAQYPQHHDAIIDHHQTHLGISRFEKFGWIYRELLRRQPAAGEFDELGRRFSTLVDEGTRTCPEVSGATGTLERLHTQGVPLFVASGTPQAELDGVIKARGWHRLFQGVFGAPQKKPDMLVGIAASLGCTPGHLVFVGDGWSDHQAAHQVGAAFVLRATEAQVDRFSNYDGPRIRDLQGFADRLQDWSA